MLSIPLTEMERAVLARYSQVYAQYGVPEVADISLVRRIQEIGLRELFFESKARLSFEEGDLPMGDYSHVLLTNFPPGLHVELSVADFKLEKLIFLAIESEEHFWFGDEGEFSIVAD